MTLLFNVYITDQPANKFNILKENRGNLESFNSLDVTKYSLSSLAKAYTWDKAIINIELDTNRYTSNDSIAMQDFVLEIFKGINVVYSNKRNRSQADWIKTYYNINSDFIFYLGNHDHIFIDSSATYITNLVDYAKESYGDYVTITCSHWPENIRCAKTGYIHFDESGPSNLNSHYKLNTNHIYIKDICLDSLNIISKKLYEDWFLVGNWGNNELLRTDGVTSIGSPSIKKIKDALGLPLPDQEILIPYKEQFRHFDGYMHQRLSHAICPPISIPPGFFESDIKVRYGYDKYKDGWVNLNPKMNFKAYDINGVDDRITPSDLPLFWQDKISIIDINDKANEEELIQHRLLTVLKMIYSDMRYNQYIDKELEEMVLNEHLKDYDQYKLAKEEIDER